MPDTQHWHITEETTGLPFGKFLTLAMTKRRQRLLTYAWAEDGMRFTISECADAACRPSMTAHHRESAYVGDWEAQRIASGTLRLVDSIRVLVSPDDIIGSVAGIDIQATVNAYVDILDEQLCLAFIGDDIVARIAARGEASVIEINGQSSPNDGTRDDWSIVEAICRDVRDGKYGQWLKES